MSRLISDGETAPEIGCRPSSMTSANISDGNKRSHPLGMNAVIMHLLDGRRPQIRGSATSDTLVLTSCTSRMVGDSERDPLHSELIHPVIGEAATAHHTITNQPIIHSPAPLLTDPPTPLNTLRVYKEEASRPSKTLSLIERSERFPNCLLVRFLRHRRGLKHPFSLTSLPTISSTSPCRLLSIYDSCMSATIRLCKILVHTPSLAPLPSSCSPGHSRGLTGDGRA